MERTTKRFYPFVSIVFIIATLFSIVFLQMEERRRGYELLRHEKEYRLIVESNSQKKSQIAHLVRPDHIEAIAGARASLQKVQKSQIIHLTGVR